MRFIRSKNVDQIISFMGQKNGSSVYCLLNLEEVGRWSQAKDRGIDTRSPAQMAPWLLLTLLWERQFSLYSDRQPPVHPTETTKINPG